MPRYKELDEEDFTGSPRDLKMWKVRSTLLRVKRPVRVIEPPTKRDHPRGKLMDPKSPPKPPFHCRDTECDTCFPQFFPAVYRVSNEEAHESIDTLVDGIKPDLEFLRSAVAHHADFLITRWKKKSRNKRLSFLVDSTDLFERKWAPVHLIQGRQQPEFPRLSADPVQHAIHQRLDDFLHAYITDKTATDAYRASWMLPYLDAETLADDPLRFLSLLYTRTINEPEAWVMFDSAQLVLSEQVGVLMPEYNPNCVITEGPNFGRIVKWSAEKAHCWAIVGYNKAQYILTAQRTMMGFLRTVVGGILQEANDFPTTVSQPKWQKPVENKFSSFGNTPSVSWSEHANQPFSSPPKFDPVKLVDMMDARYHAAVDDMWLAQTHPAYVQLLVRGLVSTAFFEHTNASNKWQFVIDELMFNQFRREWYWRQMHKECHRLLQCFDPKMSR